MRVVVASSETPFVAGGATLLVDWLGTALRNAGHEVETFRLPFDPDPAAWLEQYLGFRLLDAASAADRLITLRPPAHLLPAENKVAWFIHHLRGAFDLWGTPYQDVPATVAGGGLRESVRSADTRSLSECRRLFVNSKVMAGRVKQYNGLDAEVLYPPLAEPERFRNLGDEGYFLYVSRVTPHKRQHLAVEAAALANVPLVIAGACSEGDQSYVESMQSAAGSNVRFETRWISEDEKAEWIGRCRAVLYFPFEEDSYGYPVLEAFSAGKPVITMTDSGGTLEVIRDGEEGVICDASPAALAEAMTRLQDSGAAYRMGQAGRAALDRLQLNWPSCVQTLLS